MGIRFNLPKKGWIYPLFIVIPGFCYYISFFNYGISLGDEGFFVYGAERVLQGQLPMSDFTSYPPGSYFLLALLFKVFGVNLLVSRLMEMTFLIINGLLVFYVGKRLMPEKWALIPSFILIISPGFWHKVFLTFGLLLPLIMLLRFLEKKTITRILGVGWAIGIALIFRIESALFSVITVFFVLFCNHIWKAGSFSLDKKAIFALLEEMLLCGLSAFSILISVILYYYYQSDLVKFLNWLKESYGASSIGWVSDFFGRPDPIKALTTFHIGSLKNLFFFLFILLYLYGFSKIIIHYFILKKKSFPYILPVLIMGILSLSYASIPFSKPHLLQVAAMGYILFGFIVYSFIEKKGVQSKVILFVLVLLLGLYILDNFKMRSYFASGSISRLYMIKKKGERLIPSKKARIYVEENEFGTIHGLIQFFEKRDDYLMPLVFDPMINFLTGLKNPTRFHILLPPFLEDRSNQKQVIDAVERYKIQYLLVARAFWISQDNLGFSRYAPILYEFVIKHYELEKEIGGYLIFSRQLIQNHMIQGGAER